jgi:hypothetical protein
MSTEAARLEHFFLRLRCELLPVRRSFGNHPITSIEHYLLFAPVFLPSEVHGFIARKGTDVTGSLPPFFIVFEEHHSLLPNHRPQQA